MRFRVCKGKNLIAKDVISYMDGVKLHSVKDIVIGMGNETVVVLLVEEGGAKVNVLGDERGVRVCGERGRWAVATARGCP